VSHHQVEVRVLLIEPAGAEPTVSVRVICPCGEQEFELPGGHVGVVAATLLNVATDQGFPLPQQAYSTKEREAGAGDLEKKFRADLKH
jgi:hypothetical protein